MAGTYENHIDYYYFHIGRRFVYGHITEEKYERLRDKLDEWAEYAERNVEGGD